MMTPTQARRAGEALRNVGMALAAQRREWHIARDTLRLLDAIAASADGTASTDDAVHDLADAYADGGRWRGSITRRLAADGLIAHAGVVHSDRPSRHRGYVARWRAVDGPAIDRRRDELRRWLADHPYPPDPEPAPMLDLFGGMEGGREI